MSTDDTSSAAMPLDDAQFRLLVDFVDGLLDAPARADVDRLLLASADARAAEEWLRRVTRVASRVPLTARSPLLEQRLKRHFRRWTQAQEVLASRARRLTAIIVADSRHDRALAGVRGPGDAVSLLYRCDVGELALDLQAASDDAVMLDGQLLLDARSDAPYFGVRAVGAGLDESTETDEFGRFCFQNLPVQPIRIRLDNGEFDISAFVDLDTVDPNPAIIE